MLKNKKTFFLRILIFTACFAVLIITPVFAVCQSGGSKKEEEMCVLSMWQIDCFEGGKGSRSAYLQNLANDFSKKENCYVNVTSISADAARMNIENGNLPDLISYGAGMWGIESLLKGEKPYTNWCHGSYCLLSLEENCKFDDVTAQNTVINEGTGNLISVAAIFLGLDGASTQTSTGAYVKLINGDFKYLLGTQRDVFRLKTRGVSFSVKPVTEFNDLYQNVSAVCTDKSKRGKAEKFINYIVENKDGIKQLGLFVDGMNLYDDELRVFEGQSYDYTLIAPISKATKNELDRAISNCDVKNLKTLLN